MIASSQRIEVDAFHLIIKSYSALIGSSTLTVLMPLHSHWAGEPNGLFTTFPVLFSLVMKGNYCCSVVMVTLTGRVQMYIVKAELVQSSDLCSL